MRGTAFRRAAYAGAHGTLAENAPRLAILPARPRTPTIGGFRLTALIHRSEHTVLYRAASAQERIGPGCYVVKAAKKPGQSAVGASLLRREAAVSADASGAHLSAVLLNQLSVSQPHLVLGYLEGTTLARSLRYRTQTSNGALQPLASCLAVARQIASALSELHRAGWIHGQVRPQHILVSPRGFATLVDFSQARRLESAECEAGPVTSLAARYAAPECFARSGRLTAASDVYSLGVVLYELLCGSLPFSGTDARQLGQGHRSMAAPDLRRARPEASLEAAELLRRMLAKEALRRPIANELVRWLAAIEIEELASL